MNPDPPSNASISPAEFYEAQEDVPTNPSTAPTLGDIIQRRFSRRDLLRGALGISALGALSASPLAALAAGARTAADPATDTAGEGEVARATRFAFTEIEHGVDETHHVAPGYTAEVLIRWGDPVLPGAPAFDPAAQSPAAQSAQFGYNNDFVGYVPLPPGSDDADHGLLCVNHEYTNPEVMFPGPSWAAAGEPSLPEAEVQLAAHGGSILEVRREDGSWRGGRRQPLRTAHHRPGYGDALSGPAAGHDARLQTHGRSERHQGRRHTQQLRRRYYALGHLSDGGGELPLLLHPATWTAIPNRPTTPATASRAAVSPGPGSSTASTSTRSPTRPTVSAGSSRSTRSTNLDTGQAHGARPLQARGCGVHRQRRRSPGDLQR
jgi:hypothetical protein